MNQEEPSLSAASDVQYSNSAIQAGDPVGERTSSSSLSNGPPPRKRAPLASVACQDCRRRKTKCDGGKPSCSNCTKRGVPSCTYDLEPNQSRVAAYKQKIEQQISSIKKLEEEIEVLKSSSFHSGGVVVRNPISEPTPSSSNNPSGGVPMRLLLNPAPEPNGVSSDQRSPNTIAPYLAASLPPVQTVNREAELLYHHRNLEIEMRKLQDENRTLRTLISLLNSIDDRKTAQNMATEIHTHGVSDDLLSRAQHLVASQRPPGRIAENPWSVP